MTARASNDAPAHRVGCNSWLGSAPQPDVRMPVSMNRAHDTDDRRKDLVVDAVGKLRQQAPPKPTVDYGKAFGCAGDLRDSGIHRVDESPRRVGRAGYVPIEHFADLGPRTRADKETRHLPKLAAELVPQLGPRTARGRIAVRLRLAAVELGGEGR